MPKTMEMNLDEAQTNRVLEILNLEAGKEFDATVFMAALEKLATIAASKEAGAAVSSAVLSHSGKKDRVGSANPLIADAERRAAAAAGE